MQRLNKFLHIVLGSTRNQLPNKHPRTGHVNSKRKLIVNLEQLVHRGDGKGWLPSHSLRDTKRISENGLERPVSNHYLSKGRLGSRHGRSIRPFFIKQNFTNSSS